MKDTPFVFNKGSLSDDQYREESDKLYCTKKVEFPNAGSRYSAELKDLVLKLLDRN
jgi:hypothetical protein